MKLCISTLPVLVIGALALNPGRIAAEARPALMEERKVDVAQPIALWPGVAPGDKGDIGEEKDTTSEAERNGDPKKYVARIGNVSKPTITVYKPPKDKDTGAAVVVCPGGGYSILAMNLEGTEVCQWLNSVGVTGVLLKYRVPARKERERYAAPLQDAQRALGIVRHRAKEWAIDPGRIGILGFSAGGHLSAVLCANNATRTYPAVDDADNDSCRPDFAVLIYPAYLAVDDLSHLAPEVAVTAASPPAFITMTQDDPIHIEGALLYALALKHARVPFELHVYPKGGHGYGLRPSENLVSQWPQRAEGWLSTQGWLKPRK